MRLLVGPCPTYVTYSFYVEGDCLKGMHSTLSSVAIASNCEIVRKSYGGVTKYRSFRSFGISMDCVCA